MVKLNSSGLKVGPRGLGLSCIRDCVWGLFVLLPYPILHQRMASHIAFIPTSAFQAYTFPQCNVQHSQRQQQPINRSPAPHHPKDIPYEPHPSYLARCNTNLIIEGENLLLGHKILALSQALNNQFLTRGSAVNVADIVGGGLEVARCVVALAEEDLVGLAGL
jgi:hypothetical protein